MTILRIQRSPKASLSSVDAQGRSFLFLALEVGEYDIADHLLEIHRDDDDILFGKDKQNRTLFHAAVLHCHNQQNIIIKLIEAALRKGKIHLYLERDNELLTVLHRLANLGNDKIY